jgi:hypothetical protein
MRQAPFSGQASERGRNVRVCRTEAVFPCDRGPAPMPCDTDPVASRECRRLLTFG